MKIRAFTQSLNHKITQLLDSFAGRHFFEDQRVKDGENVFAVGKDFFEGGLSPGLVPGLALPALEDFRRDVDILAEFLQGMPAQKEAVEERRLVLRLGELMIERGSHTTHHGKAPVVRVKRNRHGETKSKIIS
jgi:hypothetical protein